MEIKKFFTAALSLLAILLLLPKLASADVEIANRSVWYVHVDLEGLRQSEAGETLYQSLDQEMFSKIREELGIDLNKDVNSLTVFSTEEDGEAIIVDGKIEAQAREKLLAMAAQAEKFETFTASGKTFYFVWQPKMRTHDGSVKVEAIDKGTYFSFDLDNRVVLSSRKEVMEGLLASGGKVKDAVSTEQLFSLNTDNSLMHGGLMVEDIDGAGGWDSNLLNNAEQIAFKMTGVENKLVLEGQLVVRDPEMAISLANIARGIISLQVFSTDIDPALVDLLKSTKIEVEGGMLNVSVSVDPEQLPRPK